MPEAVHRRTALSGAFTDGVPLSRHPISGVPNKTKLDLTKSARTTSYPMRSKRPLSKQDHAGSGAQTSAPSTRNVPHKSLLCPVCSIFCLRKDIN